MVGLGEDKQKHAWSWHISHSAYHAHYFLEPTETNMKKKYMKNKKSPNE